MTFPTKLLAPGEEIYIDSRPNWSYLFWPSVVTVIVLAGCIAAVVLWGSAPVWVGWALLAVSLGALAYLAARYIGWRTKSFVVTSQRIVYRTGAVRRTGREIPIGRVQDVTYHQTVVERIVRAGSLTVESAGRQGRDPFPDISRPAEVQSLINRVVAQAAGAYAPQQGLEMAPLPLAAQAPPASQSREPAPPPITDPTPLTPPQATIAQQLAQLAELHQHGVITDAEYEQKRREMLDRL
jgi:membrane protein YdbS with pleckstrin-like domain